LEGGELMTRNYYCSAQGPCSPRGEDHLDTLFTLFTRMVEIGEPDAHGGRILKAVCPKCGADIRRFEVEVRSGHEWRMEKVTP
jgi:hypothetical protein